MQVGAVPRRFPSPALCLSSSYLVYQRNYLTVDRDGQKDERHRFVLCHILFPPFLNLINIIIHSFKSFCQYIKSISIENKHKKTDLVRDRQNGHKLRDCFKRLTFDDKIEPIAL